MGWPLRKRAKWNEFGGSFIYPMGEDKICIGMVCGLDYTDATFSVHDALQQLKTHPFVKKLLEGGEREAWGAKTIPSGGYWSMPRKLAVPGMVIAGDSATMVNIPELKGIHYAMHAGHVRGRGDRRGAQARGGGLLRLRRARSQERRSARTSTSGATAASRSRRASSSAARSPAR